MKQKISTEGMVLFPFNSILPILLEGSTIFAKASEGVLSLKYCNKTKQLLGCTLEDGYLIEERYKPIDLTVSELLGANNLQWYRYIKFNAIEDEVIV